MRPESVDVIEIFGGSDDVADHLLKEGHWLWVGLLFPICIYFKLKY